MLGLGGDALRDSALVICAHILGGFGGISPSRRSPV
jgi:hypothetical protein